MPYDKRQLGRLIGIGIVGFAILLLSISIVQVDYHPRTDDATVRANAIRFAPEVEGRLVSLNVKDNQAVHKGDVLYVIDPRPFEYALELAKSDQATLEGQIDDRRRLIATEKSAVGTALAGVSGSQSGISAAQANYLAAQASVEHATAAQSSAEAQLRFAQNDYNRIAPLLAKHYVTVAQVDQAQTVLSVAQEANHEATSQLLQAKAQESSALAAKESAGANFEASKSKLGEAQHTVDTLENPCGRASQPRSQGAAGGTQPAMVLCAGSIRRLRDQHEHLAGRLCPRGHAYLYPHRHQHMVGSRELSRVPPSANPPRHARRSLPHGAPQPAL